MQINFSVNFPINCQTWKPCNVPPHLALFLLLSFGSLPTWLEMDVPKKMIAFKYKWAAEKPVGNYGNPTSLLLLVIQLLKFLEGNLQWMSAQDRAVSVCPNQEEPK